MYDNINIKEIIAQIKDLSVEEVAEMIKDLKEEKQFLEIDIAGMEKDIERLEEVLSDTLRESNDLE